MGDERTRALGRRFRESGAPEDEAAWLQELLRQGDLNGERLALAAILGSPGAQLVLGVSAPLPAHRSELEEWVHLVVDAGRRPALTAAYVLAAAATRAHLASPELEQVLTRGREAVEALHDPAALARFRPALFLRRAGSGKRAGAAQQALASAHQAMGARRRMVRAWTQATRSATLQAIGLRATIEALRAGLLPWLLADSGPLDLEPSEAVFLFAVAGASAIAGRGVALDPGASLSDVPSSGAVFRLELRLPDGTRRSCRGEASASLLLPFAEPLHQLLVPLSAAEVPLGTEVWELGC